jgi:hypothetical protein
MYIVPIAWAYVVVIMAAGDSSAFNGVMTLILWGVLPISIFVYIFGTPKRRRERAQADHQAQLAAQEQATSLDQTDLTEPRDSSISELPAAHPLPLDDDKNTDKKNS